MKKKNLLFGTLVACLFMACSPIQYVGIQVYNPSEVSFPAHAKKILLVDNAVVQPERSGYTYSLLGIRQDTARAYADSACMDACRSLGEALADASFFEDVLLYNRPFREDGNFLEDTPLTQDEVKKLCAETGADAVLSFDRLLFRMDKEVVRMAGGLFGGDIAVRIVGTVRGYLPEMNKPLATVLLQDSLFWEEVAETPLLLHTYLPNPSEALRAAGNYIGTQAAPCFVPHWTDDSRWLFKRQQSRWKEAVAYVMAEKWHESIPLWRVLYERSSRQEEKAEVASNLALAYEMETDLKEALFWAEKSHQLFLEKKGMENQYVKLQALYVEALKKRILSDRKLIQQLEIK